MMKEIFLGSKSPRRREILEKCGVQFIQEPAEIDETLDASLPIAEAIQDLSLRKAKAILKKHPDAVVIGSDTCVCIHDRILGKPGSEESAFAMLKELQGNTHQVITGFAMTSSKRTYCTAVTSNVTFAEMTDDEILSYIATGECFDKAGAYGIQGFGGRYIRHIDGDYYAIMGLPLHEVYEELKKIGLY